MSIQEQDLLTSPRLQRLRDALAQKKPRTLTEFWQEVETQGTPLIEPIEGDQHHYLVTFLWRAVEEKHTVTISSSLTGSLSGWSSKQHRFANLLGTDIWYRSYRVPGDTRTTYQLGLNDPLAANEEEEDTRKQIPLFRVDPLGARTFVLQADPEIEDEEEVQSMVELPAAPTQKWSAIHPYAARGKLEMHRLRSNLLENTRRVWVYTPPGYDPQSIYGVLLLFDGGVYAATIPTPVILDNLLAAGRIPPLVAILVCSLNWEDRERELSCYPPFVRFLTDELLPWVKQRYAISLHPEQMIVGGSSYGGLAAAFAGLIRPDIFGNVLAQSGSFYWTPEGDEEFEWITRQYAIATNLPRRYYLSVGHFENNPRRSDSGPTQLAAVRHFRDVLHARGREVHYQECNSGHDYCAWYGSLADGIQALAGRLSQEQDRP
ncbi:MAG: alpha/beta hydrolase-fold protein [Ktedonobacteraceae bacterium]